MSMERIMVTGGAGFIGSNLVRRLHETCPDAAIMVVDDFRVGTFENLAFGHNEPGGCFRGEVIARPLNELDLDGLFEEFQPEVVFHEAAITDTTVTDQAQMIRDNVEPFEILLELACERAVTLVWASSAATYGMDANGATAARRPFRLEDAGRPANVYGFSKWVMENLHHKAMADSPEAKIVGLRYFNVFGPGEQHKGKMASMVYQLAQQMLAGKEPRIFHDGEQARDQVCVGDVVDATIAAAAGAARSGIYNVGSGKATSFNQIIAALNKALATDRRTDYFDNPYTFYQDYTCADLIETANGLGWRPTHEPEAAIIDYARLLQAGA